MMLTKEVLAEIEPGEIFKTVTTRLQNFHEPMKMTLRFVCIKGRNTDMQDWAIYAGRVNQSDEDIARIGDKVQSLLNIQSICPCDEGAYELYRQ